MQVKTLSVFPRIRFPSLPPRFVLIMTVLLMVTLAFPLGGCSRKPVEVNPTQPGQSGPFPSSPGETGTSPISSEPGGTEPSRSRPEPPPWWPDEPALPGGLLVIVENHPDARPQSGLDRADTVFELDVVAGITRFLAVYYRQAASEIGPIRSGRWAFYYLAQGYGLPFAHVGANVDLIRELKQARHSGFPDMDDIYGAGGYFWRDQTRSMPHNTYSSTDLLLKGVRSLRYTLKAPPEFSFLSEGEEPPAGSEPATSIRIPFADDRVFRNIVTWEYIEEYGGGSTGLKSLANNDAPGGLSGHTVEPSEYAGNENRAGRYSRAINGKPHVMRDGTTIQADNVILLVTDTQNVVKHGEPIKENRVTGQGEALLFTGGRVYRGIWSKPQATSPLQFLYRDSLSSPSNSSAPPAGPDKGVPMKLAPGQTWIEVIGKDVKYSFEAPEQTRLREQELDRLSRKLQGLDL